MLSWYFKKRFLRACCAELTKTMQDAEVGRLRAAACRRKERLLSSLPREETFGGRLVMRFAVLGAALFSVLADTGMERRDAIDRVAGANRRALKPLLSLLSFLAPILGRTRLLRAQRVWTFWNRTFPFAPPAWERTDVLTDEGSFGFDYTRCPIAEFNRRQGSLDLCSAAFCQIDYWIGDALKVRLERDETLASDNSRCNFRWWAS
jgi:ubiquinone biosynthesis protein|tara:strand:- start:1119 stop:1736 length:618 start_codon:yes stop_codon:yes gene_type:complete